MLKDMEKFDPHDATYKRVEDLPENFQDNFINLPTGGFIHREAFEFHRAAHMHAKEANDNRALVDKLLAKDKVTPTEVLHGAALTMDTMIEERKDYIVDLLREKGISNPMAAQAFYSWLSEKESQVEALESNIGRFELMEKLADVYFESGYIVQSLQALYELSDAISIDLSLTDEEYITIDDRVMEKIRKYSKANDDLDFGDDDYDIKPLPRGEAIPNEFFTNSTERGELFKYSKAVAEFMHDNDVADLVVVDRSSRPLYIGVKEYWRYKYPHSQMPGIYFVNPKGFIPTNEISQDDIEEGSFREDSTEPPHTNKTRKDIVREFKDTYTLLMRDSDKPILLFDACIHSGDTLTPVAQTLRLAGLRKLIVGSICPADPGSSIDTDFYITKQIPVRRCYPFDQDRMIEKTFDTLYSQRTKDSGKRERAVKLTEDIQKIMKEYIEREEISDKYKNIDKI